MASKVDETNSTSGENQEKSANTKDAVGGAPAPRNTPPDARPAYSALSPGRRRFILWIVTAAGFFGPLAGGIYLPALPTLQRAFHTSATAINATVSVFMGVLAVAVSLVLAPWLLYTAFILFFETECPVAALLGIFGRLRWAKAFIYGFTPNLYYRQYLACSATCQPSCSLHIENSPRLRCC